ncbi:MAG: DUF5060 domain-containing protein [Planctomycetota bacterium]
MPPTRQYPTLLHPTHAIALVLVSVLATTANLTDTHAQTAWQPWTLDFAGPQAQEVGGAFNPFLDRRLDVTFTGPSGQSYVVPGFFAADGNAATSHAESGNLWRTRFTPDEAGAWSYTTSFRQGANVAVADNPSTFATDNSIHNQTGTFSVAPRDASAPGFLSSGRLAYTGNHYLQTLGDGRYWIKTGADSPENLLGYLGFDNTTSQNGSGPNYNSDFGGRTYGRLHQYPTHRADWNPGDPDWSRDPSDPVPGTSGDRDGRNLIGAINYLADTGVNSVFFLPMNLGGDAQDTYPFVEPNEASNTRYDVSKLAQWEIAMAHAQTQGINLQVVLNEAEFDNKNFLDDATLGTERKLFYREMVARFGHHNGLYWNISEEYNGFPADNSDLDPDTIKEWAAFISSIDPYDHPVTVHNARNPADTDDGPWAPFFGEPDFDLTSLQSGQRVEGWSDIVEEFRIVSDAAGRPIAVMIDEAESITRIPVGVNDDTDPTGDTLAERYNTVRKSLTWDILLSGGGVGWFVHDADQPLEDFRLYEQVFAESAIARGFLEDHLPFWRMTPDDDLVRNASDNYGGAEAFALLGEAYAVYLPDGSMDELSPLQLDLTDFDGELFSARWFDPRTGAFIGPAFTLVGGDWVDLGPTPDGFSNTNDWALLVQIPEPASGLLVTLALAVLLARQPRHGPALAYR